MFYVILSRSLMHRLFYYSTAAVEVKVVQGFQLLMQLLKDLKNYEEEHQYNVTVCTICCSPSTDFSSLLDMHSMWHCPWQVSMDVP